MLPTQHLLASWQYVWAGHVSPFAQLCVPDGQAVLPLHPGGRSLGS